MLSRADQHMQRNCQLDSSLKKGEIKDSSSHSINKYLSRLLVVSYCARCWDFNDKPKIQVPYLWKLRAKLGKGYLNNH